MLKALRAVLFQGGLFTPLKMQHVQVYSGIPWDAHHKKHTPRYSQIDKVICKISRLDVPWQGHPIASHRIESSQRYQPLLLLFPGFQPTFSPFPAVVFF